MKKYMRLILSITILIALLVIDQLIYILDLNLIEGNRAILQIKRILQIACSFWVLIELAKLLKIQLLKRFDISGEDNLKSRKVHTQINILHRIVVFVLVIICIGMVFLSIDSFKEIGIGIFSSVGVAGIIIGLSAQKIVGALLAGIQIAISQPFRLDDAVVVENEWGWIEEINLTFIVVRLWDKRRLVLPTTYFLEKPFQNWTRTTADIIGSVFLYTDYSISFEALRNELTRLLNSSKLWDGKVNVLQVTDSKASTIEIRILVSAKNSPTAWDLRVYIREKMIEFIQTHYPESLPKTRIVFQEKNNASMG